ncbi:Gfo/Idh/MocA family protein [Paenibacillus contaminans]|uniref:Gfo/Idh/MocA family oxidoreductase n=1 Tax=Paenibacillus contaminans TaxID=450362 RepID=A0A329MEZ8_9BACL|nr:Gfo/Idh/MocA family oxidoreductase [Paenibacillus contaminans]RAV17796.1 gfo/Idh/MocA family oxidoreductase [Paenibacillus contaminans]
MDLIGTDSKVRLGIIGNGERGRGLLSNLMMMDDVIIAAVSDVYEDRLQMAVEIVEAAGQERPEAYRDYKAILARDDIDGVIIATSWSSHVDIALAAMRAGKRVGLEVSGATALEECFALVQTSESSGVPCMLLENCCYGREEMALHNMVKQGIFGELIHCQGGYGHDIREAIAYGRENRNGCLDHYVKRNGDTYPTHGLGPVAKYLGINRGNRFVTLASIASKSRGLREWSQHHLDVKHPMRGAEIAQGDIVTTMIKCANGETILLVHDTMLPRPYSRNGRVQGTKGIWMEDNKSIYIEGESVDHAWEPFDKYRSKYEHPLWKEFILNGVQGGHGGMDYLCLSAFVESIKLQTEPPIDVYDMAAWMAVTVLSEQSIALGGHPVNFPDFTCGKWVHRSPSSPSKYSLD